MADEDARSVAERMARELLRVLAGMSPAPTLRVTDAIDGVACLVQVWDAKLVMPTAVAEKRTRTPARRDECRANIVEVVQAAGEPLTRKEVVRALKLAGRTYSASTVAKALADLTKAGELVNTKDKKGYRLPGWRRSKTPSLFD